ncbi:MAG TPA: hypothetical protein VJH92_02255 [Candidatus Nanoarchaeia archaeon]|nr:hypothetical protein [Candidatus Nanoarchaeia archaeon]
MTEENRIIKRPGLVLTLNTGNGFSLNYEDKRWNVTLKTKNHHYANFEINYGEGKVEPISIFYGSPYKIANLKETALIPFRGSRGHNQIGVRIVAPREVKILRHDLEQKFGEDESSQKSL